MPHPLKYIICIFSLISIHDVFGQESDTLKFYSNIFKEERTVIINTPEFYKYSSDKVKLPVLFLLDGQHEWFINPALNSIQYLQYTHEIPQMIVVIIPLINRVKECDFNSLSDSLLPLHNFIINEVREKLKNYHPGEYRLIEGHSFSASFALYSYLKAPRFYSAVIANTPLYKMEELVNSIIHTKEIKYENIYLSVGSADSSKDFHHRANYELLKKKYPSFFTRLHCLEANNSAHNAVPIVSNPFFLSVIFNDFRKRYNHISKIMSTNNDTGRQLLYAAIQKASFINNTPYSPEVADINGMASEFVNSERYFQAIAIYELGITLYPNYYEFYEALFELYQDKEPLKAKNHLLKAIELLEGFERNPDNAIHISLLKKIQKQKGW